MTSAVRDRVVDAITSGRATVQQLADIAGVKYATIYNLKRRPDAKPNVELGLALSAALDQIEGPAVVYENDTTEPNTDLIPVHDVSASAGPGAFVESEDYAAYSLAFPPGYVSKLTRTNPKNLAIISVKGESMAPTLHDDDIVMLDTSKTNLDYDGLFVLRFGETLHVKRVTRSPKPGHIKIISDNSSLYPAEDWPASDVTVVGKVIWKGGKI